MVVLSPSVLTGLAQNRARVQERVREAARAVGRDPEGVRIVTVTKKVSAEVARALVEVGATELGENRVDELERKVRWFRARGLAARWHFIGHLQRNKAKRVFPLADEIHAVDSARLLETLLALAAERPERPGLYLQVKLADEQAKGGLAPEEVEALVTRLQEDRGLPLFGLMAMAPLETDPTRARERARETFDGLAALARTLPADAFAEGRPLLSMGMSGDLEEAIAAGADCVRIGSSFYRGLLDDAVTAVAPLPPVDEGRTDG